MTGATPDVRPVIVIFGAAVRPDGQPSRTLRVRVEAALALGTRLEHALYLPTGGIGHFGDAEAVVMARLLREAGVAEADIRPEPTAHDTVSSVRAVRRMLLALRGTAHCRGMAHFHGMTHCRGMTYVATSAYHLPRCVVLLWLAGVAARACPPPPALAAAAWRKRWWWRLREVPALPWDAAFVVWLRVTGRI